MAMVGRAILQFVQMAVLARLLAPADFGLMAIVLSVTAFMQVFADMGVSNAIIHYRSVSHRQLSSLYWLNVAVGFCLMLLVMASSPLISRIFSQPSLQPILMLISINLLFVAVGQQIRVMAEKELRFSILAKIELTAALTGFVAALSFAWVAPSVYALVAGVLVTGVIQSALLWRFAARGWFPEFRLRLGEIRLFLKYGGFVVGNDLVNSINQQIDVLIGGRLFSAATLGFYSMPRNLSLRFAGIINPIVTRVGLPVMAAAQTDRLLIKQIYLKTMRMTASINFPVYLGLAVFHRDVVILLFGQKWLESAPLLGYLALWGMFRSCGNPAGSLLLAVGRPDLSFRWNLALLVIVGPTLWIGAHWGIESLAMAQALLMAVLLMPGWYFLVRPTCGATSREYAESLLSPMLCSAIAILAGYLSTMRLASPFWSLACVAFIAAPVYIVVSYFINRSWIIAMRGLLLVKSSS
jgi:O-antigen/teichoic acid export membrane protein